MRHQEIEKQRNNLIDLYIDETLVWCSAMNYHGNLCRSQFFIVRLSFISSLIKFGWMEAKEYNTDNLEKRFTELNWIHSR